MTDILTRLFVGNSLNYMIAFFGVSLSILTLIGVQKIIKQFMNQKSLGSTYIPNIIIHEKSNTEQDLSKTIKLYEKEAFAILYTSGNNEYVEIKNEITKIGRSSHCDIPLTDKLASSIHTVIQKEGNRLYILDYNSSNGTLLNGKKLKPQIPYQIRDGSLIELGTTRFNIKLCNSIYRHGQLYKV